MRLVVAFNFGSSEVWGLRVEELRSESRDNGSGFRVKGLRFRV